MSGGNPQVGELQSMDTGHPGPELRSLELKTLRREG